MPHEIIRRQQLGLTITGPFSRNYRRSAKPAPKQRPRLHWRNLIPYAISAAVALAGITFLALIFI